MNASSEPPPLAAWNVALLAGGLATRMRPITETVPKCLVPVAGEPFLHHQLRLLHRHGFRRVVLCVGHLGEMIRAAVGDGRRFGMRLEYSFDGPELLGTGGAVRRALPWLGEAFVVLYGDSYLPMDYAAAVGAFAASGKRGLLTVFDDRGLRDTDGIVVNGVIRRYEKDERAPGTRHTHYGLGILHADVLVDYPPDSAFDLADVYRDLSRTEQLAGYVVRQRLYEIGSPEGLAELDALLRTSPSIVRP